MRNLYLVNRATNVFSLEDLHKGSQPLGGYSRWGFPLRNGLVLVEWFDVDAPIEQDRVSYRLGLYQRASFSGPRFSTCGPYCLCLRLTWGVGEGWLVMPTTRAPHRPQLCQIMRPPLSALHSSRSHHSLTPAPPFHPLLLSRKNPGQTRGLFQGQTHKVPKFSTCSSAV